MLGVLLSKAGQEPEALEETSRGAVTFEKFPVLQNGPLWQAAVGLRTRLFHECGRYEEELLALQRWRSAYEKGSVMIQVQNAAEGAVSPVGIVPHRQRRTDPAVLARMDLMSGIALAALRRHDPAREDLGKAKAFFNEKPSEHAAELANIEFELQRIAEVDGGDVVPTHVGPFSSLRRLNFEGNKTFAPEKLRSGLMQNSSFLLASHPSAAMAEYKKVISECLERGYRHSGFPGARVLEARYVPGKDARLVFVIDEGARCRNGPVVVTGAKDIAKR